MQVHIWLNQLLATIGLIVLSPIILTIALLVYLQDRHSPLYIASRTGRHGNPFRMIKMRSMVVNADKSGVDSTSADDKRITAVGHFIRRFKVDELMQLVNVAKGEMALVGPRPNVKWATDAYSLKEKPLLSVYPGITDFSSIVYSDEGEILSGSTDPDSDYKKLIEPGKNELGLFYVANRSTWLDIRLIVITVVAIVSKASALKMTCAVLRGLGANETLVKTASRVEPLKVT